MNSPQSAIPAGGLRALAARRPVALFLALAFGLAYSLAALLILAQRGALPGASWPSRVGVDPERAASLLMLLLGLFPAAVLVTALEGGRPAVRALFRRAFRWRVGLGWWLVAAAGLPATTVGIALLLGDSPRAPGAGVLACELAAAAVAFVLVNLWEEIAWAGFLQTRLERRHNLFVAAFLAALPFAAIHLPLQVINGTTAPAALALSFVLLLVLGVIIRSLLGLVLRGTGDSLLLVGLAHTAFNRSNNLDGIAADLLVGPNRQLAALVATLLLLVALGLRLRHRLGRAGRQELDVLDRAAEPPLARGATWQPSGA